ncbi:UvrD-helicase domain-containing protein [Aureivirga sp. CE67]|uniref:UvrD-helicase domain-containing protein n=1 Tax=Aureivirga sp. CE67 TaxID=1788983 RepID=UPI0018CA6FF5|nr:UvrD-helicase domain-containing protein [Aureivirga sp. CE67]
MSEKSTFIVYNASAGSGKTFTLVKETLVLLLSTNDLMRYKRILAITFTNKAAGEMKERIIHYLKLFADKQENDMLDHVFQIISEKKPISKELICNRAKTVLENILHNYAAFSVTTIDSLTHRIIRSFSKDLGLSLNFEVEMDGGKLIEEAVDILIAKIGKDKEVTNLLLDFSLQKSEEDKSWDISRELKEFSRSLLNEDDIRELEKVKDKTIQDYKKLRKFIRSQNEIIEEQAQKIGKEALELIEMNGIEVKDFNRSVIPKYFEKLRDAFKDNDFLPDVTAFKHFENNTLYAKSKPEAVKQSIDAIAPKLEELFDDSMRYGKYYYLNKRYLNSIVPMAVLNAVRNELEQLKEENNIRLNAEFNKIINDEIRKQPVPFIYERIGQRYSDYFIDEMQDTSVLQWENLIPLIGNALHNEYDDKSKGFLLLVGDAKQAIYSFRGGKAEQFIKLSEEESEEFLEVETEQNPFYIEKSLENLTTNYRSHSAIVDFTNAFFVHVSKFLNNDSYQNLYIEGNQQNINSSKEGYVEISFVDKKNAEAEEKDLVYPKRVLEIIENMDPAFNRKDICILTRKTKDARAVAKYLSENGVDIVSSETLLINNSEKVQFIIHLLKFIHFDMDKQVKINALYFLYDHLKIEVEKHHFLAAFIDLNNKEFFEKLAEFDIEFDYADFLQKPLINGVEQIIRDFRLTEETDAYLQFFLDLVMEYQDSKGNSLLGFLSFWEQQKERKTIISPEGQDAVRIMTIHKSKGLEFPVVIFPYDLSIYGEITRKFWYPLDPEIYQGFPSLKIDYNIDKFKLLGGAAEELATKREHDLELDNYNLLYVALTRPVEQLYIISEKNIDKKGVEKTNTYSGLFINYLKMFTDENAWDENKDVYGFGSKERKHLPEKETSEIDTIQQKRFLSTPWKDHQISIVTSASLLWDTEQEEAISYGNLIHEIASKILTAADIESVVDTYVFEGVLEIEQREEIIQKLFAIVEHPILQPFFEEGIQVFNEREIMVPKTKEQIEYEAGMKGLNEDKIKTYEILIPDRMVVLPNKEAVIIDYKTGKPSFTYHKQLERYAEVIEKMNYKVSKKYLVYIDEEIVVEEV